MAPLSGRSAHWGGAALFDFDKSRPERLYWLSIIMQTSKKNKKREKTVQPEGDGENLCITDTNKYAYLVITILTFALYANTLFSDYVLDDRIVITENRFTKMGIGGIKEILTRDVFSEYFSENIVAGGRYRPLSIVSFAVEYTVFGPNPHVSHCINVLLYLMTGIVMYLLLSNLFKAYPAKKWFFSIPFLATILFICHPLHTEIVANIKGRDEILSLLFSLLALRFSIRFAETEKIENLAYSLAVFFLSLLSKESAVVFVAIIPLTIFFFKKCSLQKHAAISVPLLFSLALFLLLRQKIAGGNDPGNLQELLNNPFLYASFPQKYATIFYTLGTYVKLLFYPHPLTIDYYPYHIPIINPADARAIIPFFMYCALIAYALVGIKTKSVVSYGILFYLFALSIVSNIVFPIGTFMAERFVYTASLGYCLVTAYFFVRLLPKLACRLKPADGAGPENRENVCRVALVSAFVVVSAAYSMMTINRNRAWRDDYSLFTTDVKTSWNSAKSNSDAGGLFFNIALGEKDESKRNKYYSLAIDYFERAIKIYPDHKKALLFLGRAYAKHDKNYGKAIAVYEKYYSLNPDNFNVNRTLGLYYWEHSKNIDKALYYLENASRINGTDRENINNLGVLYSIKGDYGMSAKMFERASILDPLNVENYKNLAILYSRLKEVEKAKKCGEKVKELTSAAR
jgi:protein O-mannosyl-transferase